MVPLATFVGAGIPVAAGRGESGIVAVNVANGILMRVPNVEFADNVGMGAAVIWLSGGKGATIYLNEWR